MCGAFCAKVERVCVLCESACVVSYVHDLNTVRVCLCLCFVTVNYYYTELSWCIYVCYSLVGLGYSQVEVVAVTRERV